MVFESPQGLREVEPFGTQYFAWPAAWPGQKPGQRPGCRPWRRLGQRLGQRPGRRPGQRPGQWPHVHANPKDLITSAHAKCIVQFAQIGSGDSAVCPQHRPSSQTVFSCDRARRRPASDKGQSNRVLTEGGEFPLSLVVGLSVIVFLCGFRSRKQHARGDFRRQKRQASKASAEQYKNRRFASTKSTVQKNGASRRGAGLIFLLFGSEKCSPTARPSLYIYVCVYVCMCVYACT